MTAKFCKKFRNLTKFFEHIISRNRTGRAFDTIFRWLIAGGRGLEINTASWQADAPWGLDILRRYRELGGEYVTLGSDTHGTERLGARIPEAQELAKQAGIPWIATFFRGTPEFHRL